MPSSLLRSITAIYCNELHCCSPAEKRWVLVFVYQLGTESPNQLHGMKHSVPYCSTSPQKHRLPQAHQTCPSCSILVSHLISNQVEDLGPYLQGGPRPESRVPKRSPKILGRRLWMTISFLFHNETLINNNKAHLYERQSFLRGQAKTTIGTREHHKPHHLPLPVQGTFL